MTPDRPPPTTGPRSPEMRKRAFRFAVSALLGVALALMSYWYRKAQAAKEESRQASAAVFDEMIRHSNLRRLEAKRDAAETVEERERYEREIQRELVITVRKLRHAEKVRSGE